MCIRTHTCVCLCVRMSVCANASMCVCVCVCKCECACVCLCEFVDRLVCAQPTFLTNLGHYTELLTSTTSDLSMKRIKTGHAWKSHSKLFLTSLFFFSSSPATYHFFFHSSDDQNPNISLYHSLFMQKGYLTSMMPKCDIPVNTLLINSIALPPKGNEKSHHVS